MPSKPGESLEKPGESPEDVDNWWPNQKMSP